MSISTGPQHFLNNVLEGTLRAGLFRRLSFERQVTLCQLLLDIGGMTEAVNYRIGHSCTWADTGIGYTMQEHT